MNTNKNLRRGLLSRETKKTAKDVVSWTAAALLPLWSQQPAAEDGWFVLDNRFHSRLWNGKRQQGCRSPKEQAKSTKRLPQPYQANLNGLLEVSSATIALQRGLHH